MWTTFRVLLAGALRDRISLFWAALFPLVLMVGIGYFFPDPDYQARLFVGVLAVSTIFFSLTGTAFEVVGQRNRGVYKLLRATPFQTSGFVVALAGARCAVALLCVALVTVIGLPVLKISLDPLGLVRMIPVFMMGNIIFALIGFAAGNVAQNETQVAMINNLTTMPMIFGSEIFYSLSKAPAWIQAASKALPMSHFLQGLHTAQAGGDRLWLSLLILIGFIAVALGIAVVTFRWDPDGPLPLPLLHRG